MFNVTVGIQFNKNKKDYKACQYFLNLFKRYQGTNITLVQVKLSPNLLSKVSSSSLINGKKNMIRGEISLKMISLISQFIG